MAPAPTLTYGAYRLGIQAYWLTERPRLVRKYLRPIVRGTRLNFVLCSMGLSLLSTQSRNSELAVDFATSPSKTRSNRSPVEYEISPPQSNAPKSPLFSVSFDIASSNTSLAAFAVA